jgi:uncharacterized protein
MLWPRKGRGRGLRYVALRVLRLKSSPHSIAVGVAVGAASSFTPFFGLHIVLAVLLAWIFSGNVLAAAIATALANPITIPLILAASYEIGTALVEPQGGSTVASADIARMIEHMNLAELWGLLKPMLVGSLPLAVAAALIFYPLAFRAAWLFQKRRRREIGQPS